MKEIPQNGPVEKTVKIYDAKKNPPDFDRALLIGWRIEYPIPHLLEWRTRKQIFVSGQMPVEIDFYVYLADLADPNGVERIRQRWIERDKK